MAFSDEVVNLTKATTVLHESVSERYLQMDAARELVTEHEAMEDNPHSVTKAQVGLGSVDNLPPEAIRDRSTHTGTQPASSISDRGTAMTAAVGTADAQVVDGAVLRGHYGERFVPKVPATLDLDFAGGVHKLYGPHGPEKQALGDVLTFTRASGATRINAVGQVELLGVDEPRIDYDPETGECLGLLVEESRTNVMAYSEQFDQWGDSPNGSVLVTPNAATAPDGALTADECIPSADNVGHLIYKVHGSGATSTIYTFSVFIKPNGGDYNRVRVQLANSAYPAAASVWFNVASGEIGTVGADVIGHGIDAYPDGWFRCWVTAQSLETAGNYVAAVALGRDVEGVTIFPGDGTSGFYLWGAQIEVGAFPTSYIPTTDLAVTRAADVATLAAIAFDSAVNPNEGAILIDCGVLYGLSSHMLVELGNAGAPTNRISFLRDFLGRASIYVALDGVAQASLSITGALSSWKYGARYGIDNFAVTRDGLTPSVDTDGVVPAISQMTIGRRGDAGNQLTGAIKRITYYPRALTDVELEALTA